MTAIYLPPEHNHDRLLAIALESTRKEPVLVHTHRYGQSCGDGCYMLREAK
jgi:hypothetical protein